MKQFLAIAAAFAIVTPAEARLVVPASAFGAVRLAAPTASVRSVSVVPTSGRAHVVIGVDQSVDVNDFTLEGPYRVVIDLQGATLNMGARYDRLARGGVTNIRAAQYKPNIVRVVIEMDAPHPYELSRANGEVRVSIDGGSASFAAWYSSGSQTAARDAEPVARNAEPATGDRRSATGDRRL
ncbi:MAG TPA: AMIN domain-containing protein, partial [Gemmatimonadaceae bacterium]